VKLPASRLLQEASYLSILLPPIIIPVGWHDAGMRGLTGWWGVVLEAPDGPALARFYSSLLGWPIAKVAPEGAAIGVPGTTSYLSFDSSPDYEPPSWPAEPGRQRQMMHIDIGVSDVAAAVEDALALGARLAEFQPQQDIRVLLDPAGHPFCLYSDT
jgi:catechol 2,3-dioxygenase-like lactoylglutathione lyase family enzyme